MPEGKELESSRGRGRPFLYKFATGQVIPGREAVPLAVYFLRLPPYRCGTGWDIGVGLMTRGMRAEFLIPSSLAYGEDGRPPVIPPNTDLKVEIELIDFYDPEPTVTPRDYDEEIDG